MVAQTFLRLHGKALGRQETFVKSRRDLGQRLNPITQDNAPVKSVDLAPKSLPGIISRNGGCDTEGAFLPVKQRMREEMHRAWKDFFDKNPDMKEEDVWRWVEERLRSIQNS